MTAPEWLSELLAQHRKSQPSQFSHAVHCECGQWFATPAHVAYEEHLSDVVWQAVAERIAAGHSPYVYLKQDVFDALGASA